MVHLLVAWSTCPSTKYTEILIWVSQLVCNKMFLMFSPWNLGQIELPMTVSESAHHEDLETPSTWFSWWSFGWNIQGLRHLRAFQNLTSLQVFTDSLEMELCLQPWITQSILHQIQRSGTVWNLLGIRIPKLSMIFRIKGWVKKMSWLWQTPAMVLFNLYTYTIYL